MLLRQVFESRVQLAITQTEVGNESKLNALISRLMLIQHTCTLCFLNEQTTVKVLGSQVYYDKHPVSQGFAFIDFKLNALDLEAGSRCNKYVNLMCTMLVSLIVVFTNVVAVACFLEGSVVLLETMSGWISSNPLCTLFGFAKKSCFHF